MTILFIIQLLFLILFVVALFCCIRLMRTFSIERRISRYSIDSIIDCDDNLEDNMLKKYNKFLVSTRKRLANISFFSRRAKRYDKYLEIGGKNEVLDFIVIKLLLGIIFVCLVVLSSSFRGKLVSFWLLILCFVSGYYIYDGYLLFYYGKRKKKIKNDILRAVIIMNNAFKAGKSTMQAVEIVSKQLSAPINVEFQKIYQDLEYGISSDVAFSRFAKRVNIEEARYISSSLIILNKTGGNIVKVFSSIERTLFDKKKLETDLKNGVAASKLMVLVLIVIPILLVMIIKMLSPNYFDSLLNSGIGYFVISFCLLMFAIFIYLLIKVTKVKV